MPRRLRLAFVETGERKNKRKNKVKVEEEKKEEKKDVGPYRYEPPIIRIMGVPIPEEDKRKLWREIALDTSVPENPVTPKPIEYSPPPVCYSRTPPRYKMKIHAYKLKPRRRK